MIHHHITSDHWLISMFPSHFIRVYFLIGSNNVQLSHNTHLVLSQWSKLLQKDPLPHHNSQLFHHNAHCPITLVSFSITNIFSYHSHHHLFILTQCFIIEVDGPSIFSSLLAVLYCNLSSHRVLLSYNNDPFCPITMICSSILMLYCSIIMISYSIPYNMVHCFTMLFKCLIKMVQSFFMIPYAITMFYCHFTILQCLNNDGLLFLYNVSLLHANYPLSNHKTPLTHH